LETAAGTISGNPQHVTAGAVSAGLDTAFYRQRVERASLTNSYSALR